jgi:hypothetical protein
LSWGDVGSPNLANPSIDLFAAVEDSGGTGYLTNAAVAQSQSEIATSQYIGRISPGQSIQLNASAFANNWAGSNFIWCGVSNGTGGLTLTIADGNGNTLAHTTAYIQIVDIKQMYERWTVGEDPAAPPKTNASAAVEDVAIPFEYALPSDTNMPYILFVHGWNMERWEKDRFAESAFKRLYWQGYQGRFGTFRWPTDSQFKGTLDQLFWDPGQKDNFDSSEYKAWQSAVGLTNLLTKLNAQYPDHVYMLAHSMGNIVAGEALRLAGSSRVVNTYAASQAAISAHTYDGDTNHVPNYSFTYLGVSSGPTTPNIYGNWFATNNGGGAGTIVNFYNTNDYTLVRSHWQLDQLLKPDHQVLQSTVFWDYGYSGNATDLPPWNDFYKEVHGTGYKTTFDIVNVLTNRYEVTAYDAQSWTTALGATPNVGNVANVALPQLWPPDPSATDPSKQYVRHFWHSAEFRGDYWQQAGYWQGLLGRQGFDLLQ